MTSNQQTTITPSFQAGLENTRDFLYHNFCINLREAEIAQWLAVTHPDATDVIDRGSLESYLAHLAHSPDANVPQGFPRLEHQFLLYLMKGYAPPVDIDSGETIGLDEEQQTNVDQLVNRAVEETKDAFLPPFTQLLNQVDAQSRKIDELQAELKKTRQRA